MNDLALPSTVTNPPRRPPREAWRIEQPVWSETTETTAFLALARGFDRICAASSEAKQSRRDRRVNYRRQDDVPRGGRWSTAHCRPPVPNSALRASACSMGARHSMTCSEKTHTHTEARDARCLHASEPKLSIFSSHCQGDVHTGLGQRGHIPRQRRRSFPAKTSLSHDGLRRLCSFGISVSRQEEERDDIKPFKRKNKTALRWGRGHVHPRRCSSGAPTPTRTTSGRPLQAMSPFPHSSPQSHCLFATEKNNNTHHGTSEQRKTTATQKHPFPSSEDVADARNQPHSWVWTTNPRRRSVRLSCQVCEAHKASHSWPLLFLQHVHVVQVIPHPYDLAAA